MSGICGIIRFDGKTVEKEEIQKMLDAIQNRGNDTTGKWLADNVGFGHKMLWTTPESHYDNQPQVSQDCNLIITADARIDNRDELFKKLEIDENDFSVITDTALILRSYEKWGEECPDHLLGDFAFAIWDKKKEQLFCVRDHVGIRPFYYYIDEHFFCFSSEISSLFSIASIEKLINNNAIDTFIEHITLTYEETFFKNIKRLSSAHKIIMCAEGITYSRYWFPEKLKINKEISFEEAAKKFKNLLQDAINVRLRSAYPVGCELSGGLDSSSILCLAAGMSQGKDIIPFSQRYGDLDCDESYYSDLVAQSLGMNIQTVRVDKLDYVVEYSLERYFKAFHDWPTYGSFMGLLPVAKKIQKQNIRILLTGQGGDHIVEGNLYILVDYLKAFKFGKLYKELSYYKWSRKIIKNYVVKPILPKFIFKVKDFLSLKKRKKSVYPNNFFENEDSNLVFPTFAFKEDIDSIVGTFTSFWADSNIYHNIEKFNIESRHPYFDVRLIEFCLSIPEEYKLMHGISKRILKEAMKGILPEPVRSRNDKADFGEFVAMQLSSEFKKKDNNVIKSILKSSCILGIEKWQKEILSQKKE